MRLAKFFRGLMGHKAPPAPQGTDGVVNLPIFSSLDELVASGFGTFGHYFFHNNAQKKYIVVFFNGAMNGDRLRDTPVFNRWSWGAKCKYPVVCVSDPAATPATGLNLDWYLGRKSEWSLEHIWKTLYRIREAVAPKAQFIVMGSSGGGFAALQSAMLGHADQCFCINPQIELWRSPPGYRFDKALRYYNDDDSDVIPPEDKYRFSVIEAGKLAPKHPAKIFYAQNTADRVHFKNHFLPFLTEFSGRSHNRTKTIHHISFRDTSLKHRPPNYAATIDIFGHAFRRLMK